MDEVVITRSRWIRPSTLTKAFVLAACSYFLKSILARLVDLLPSVHLANAYRASGLGEKVYWSVHYLVFGPFTESLVVLLSVLILERLKAFRALAGLPYFFAAFPIIAMHWNGHTPLWKAVVTAPLFILSVYALGRRNKDELMEPFLMILIAHSICNLPATLYLIS